MLDKDDRDEQVIQAVVSGEVDHYAVLVDRYQEGAIRLARSLVGNYEEARDVAQEAFLSAYCALHRFQGKAKFSTWLYRIIVNKCHDTLRKHARRLEMSGLLESVGGTSLKEWGSGGVEATDAGPSPSEQLSNKEMGLRITRALEQLPLQQRTAFSLHHLHGLALEETADVMRRRVGTVKAHVFRATERLRNALTPWTQKEG